MRSCINQALNWHLSFTLLYLGLSHMSTFKYGKLKNVIYLWTRKGRENGFGEQLEIAT